MKSISLTTLQSLAIAEGLSLLAVLDRVDLCDDRRNLERWQRNGFAGDMTFMQRSGALLAHPEKVFAELVSALIIGVHYDRGPRVELPMGYGRIARYAWGRDYHKVLRKRLKRLIARVEGYLGESIEARCFSDSVPLLERAMARKAGLGFIGKNTMLIVPRAGSFLFLGEVLWDVCVDIPSMPKPSLKSRCGPCTSCIDNCPTSAFVDDYQLDARKCISYLTIEKRSELTEQERVAIGDWLFGCDICQDVCPFNNYSLRKEAAADIEELSAEHGVGQMLSLAEVLSIRSHDQFVARYAGTAIMRARREGLVRNAAVVAGNTTCADLSRELETVVREDASPMVRQHALWALFKIASQDGGESVSKFKHLARIQTSATFPQIAQEAKELLARLG
jgi:epoxyqueuosine reductase